MSNFSEANVFKNYDNVGEPAPESLMVILEKVNAYQKPTEKELAGYENIRAATVAFMKVVLENCPPCEDRLSALTQLREVRMKANSSIALKGVF